MNIRRVLPMLALCLTCTAVHASFLDFGMPSPNDPTSDYGITGRNGCVVLMPDQQQPEPIQLPVSEPEMGDICVTVLGRSGHGPVQPVGNKCWVNTPSGIVWGVVGK